MPRKVESFTATTITFSDGYELYMPFGLDTKLSTEEVQKIYEDSIQIVSGIKDARSLHKNTQENEQ